MRPLQQLDLQKSANPPANNQFLLFALPEIQRWFSITNHGFVLKAGTEFGIKFFACVGENGWVQEKINPSHGDDLGRVHHAFQSNTSSTGSHRLPGVWRHTWDPGSSAQASRGNDPGNITHISRGREKSARL